MIGSVTPARGQSSVSTSGRWITARTSTTSTNQHHQHDQHDQHDQRASR
ncbi:hypothetical protein ACIBBD_29965 [Streptomyces sp. NPDC051315]